MDKVPNLFVIGAMKSGTSSLHSWLGAHPNVFMSSKKEPGYFVKELNWNKGAAWYGALFQEAGDALVIGESSTEYTKLPDYQGVPQRIREYAPDARFIYLMRDPIERAISHYWHLVRSRADCESRDLLTVLREDSRLIDYSNYAMQLRPYFKVFGRERVLAMTLEEFAADTREGLRRIYTWLGVDPAIAATQDLKRRHETPGVVNLKVGWLARLRFSPFWTTVGPLVPSAVRKFGVRLSVRKAIDRSGVGQAEAVDFLRPIMQAQVRELEDLLRRNFTEWKTVHVSPPSERTISA